MGLETLANKVILITGASTGIGGYTAKFLSKFKPKVAIVARSTEKLKEVQKQCEEAGAGKGNVLPITADMAKQEDLSKVIDETVKAFGQIDTLVNNAAAFAINDIETTKPETFNRIIAVNLRAPFFLSQLAMPHLKKTKGSIVNISSVAAHRAVVDVAAYCISKAALEHFTRVLALEIASAGVRANAIVVGGTMTDTQSESLQLLGNEVMYELSDLKKIQPLGGTCSMEDVAKVIGFLSSDLSCAMTGTSIPVDRGSLVVPPAQPEAVSEQLSAMKNMGDFNPVATQLRLEQIGSMAKGAKPRAP
ncbi:uncharacterized oxidoreductase TM_0325-like [Littorina saxatilis]|uniref:Ketoreductase domain-containing protein n=1 Tax=Littorina saxatilis TaxID=31220 RepID=A0AAN9G0K8_9CAEN